MKRLTSDQLTAIQSLVSEPGISKVSLEFFDIGLVYISIHSIIGADFKTVDKAMDTLKESFPSLEYRGTPCNYTNPINGLDSDLYSLDYEGENLISLTITREPEWSPELVVRQEG